MFIFLFLIWRHITIRTYKISFSDIQLLPVTVASITVALVTGSGLIRDVK